MDSHHPTMLAVLRAKEAEPADLAAQRIRVKQELESEVRGLVMAARMHGFTVNLMNGTATVIDQRSPA